MARKRKKARHKVKHPKKRRARKHAKRRHAKKSHKRRKSRHGSTAAQRKTYARYKSAKRALIRHYFG
jgi:hypothetical protein